MFATQRDELEKCFAGSTSGASSDGGTSSRVFATLLTWLQEKTSPVFVIATANDISALPPEFMRAGRWDDIFFVDAPNADERLEICQIFQSKYPATKNLSKSDIQNVSRKCDGYTGAEIETAFQAAMYRAFNDGERLVQVDDVVACAAEIIPQSKSQEDKIKTLKDLVESGRARNASQATKKEMASVGFEREIEGI